MGLRTIGRWLYHAITSAEKRPYIEKNIESLELLTAQAASNRDIILLFNVLDELTYRKSSPARRDELVKKIISLLQEFWGASIAPNADSEQIAKEKSNYLAQADKRVAEEKTRKLNELRAKRDAEAKARRAEEERAKAAGNARLKAEAKAREEAKRKAQEEAGARLSPSPNLYPLPSYVSFNRIPFAPTPRGSKPHRSVQIHDVPDDC